jgi:AbrB family looped-hinge helix DNA binding protein
MEEKGQITKVVKQLRGGQLTVPKEFRERLGIKPNDLLRVTLREGRLEIAPVDTRERMGSLWLKELYDLFAPVRETIKGSEEEIDNVIERAVSETRHSHD